MFVVSEWCMKTVSVVAAVVVVSLVLANALRANEAVPTSKQVSGGAVDCYASGRGPAEPTVCITE
jgi:hypothetical protein